MALNAFAMLNNEVHWAADYPLALAIGWLSGDIAVERSKQRRQKYKEETKASPIGFQFETILPYAAGNDGAGVLKTPALVGDPAPIKSSCKKENRKRYIHIDEADK